MNQFLIVLRRFPPEGGGTEKQACLLAETLYRKTGTCSIWGARVKSSGSEDNLKSAHRICDSPLRFWGTIKFHIHLLCKLHKARNKIDSVSSYFPNETTLCLILWSILNKKKFIYTISGSAEIDALNASITKKFRGFTWKLILWRAHAIISISKTIKDQLRSIAMISDKVHYVPNGVECPPEAVTPLKNSQPNLRILCAGRLAAEKRYDHVIKAIAEIENIELIIAGDGPELSRLTKCAAELGLSDRVTFVGYQENISKLFKEIDSLVIASLYEGLSIVMLEAMAHGIPVISTPVSGARDAIIDGKNGFICDDFSINALRQKLITLKTLDKNQLSGHAGKTIQTKFDIDLIADKYIHLLNIGANSA